MNARDTADGFTGCIECDGPADDYDTDEWGRFQACSWDHADGCSEDPWRGLRCAYCDDPRPTSSIEGIPFCVDCCARAGV